MIQTEQWTLQLGWLALLLTLFASALQAQVGINTLAPDTSAILHLESTDRGFLPPRMTTAQRDNIYAPKPGLVIFNTQDSTLQYYTGRCWLPTWQTDCDACLFDFSIGSQTGNIDRIVANSDSTTLYIRQRNGSSSIGLYIISTLPQGITVNIDQAVLSGNDSTKLTVTADIFAPAGTYPIVVQAACGSEIQSQVYIVTVDPCVEIDLLVPTVNYDLQAVNNLPTNTPVCVVLRVPPGLLMTNDTSGAPVYTSGNLHPQSRVGIQNQGFMLATGGYGGVGAGLQGQSGEGSDGSNAMELTTHTHLLNSGRIYGGGGGGGSVGLLASINIPAPINTTINLGFGAGGGGGCQSGVGGNLGGGFGYYDAGNNASSGILAQPGAGGVITTPISFSILVAQATITPAVFGGSGGNYGQPGQSGSLFFNLRISVNIPIVGNTTILNQNFPDPPITNFPDGGEAGRAILRNGNTLIGVIDGNYQTTSIKGVVGN